MTPQCCLQSRMVLIGVANHSEVNSSLLNHSVNFVWMSKLVGKARRRIVLVKFLLENRHIAKANRVDGGYHNMARYFFARCGSAQSDFVYQGIKLPQYPCQAIIELLPFGSQNKWPLGPIDQLYRKEIFQMLYALAGRALGHSMIAGCLRKTSAPNYIVEDL